jgi:hypothetical protein
MSQTDPPADPAPTAAPEVAGMGPPAETTRPSTLTWLGIGLQVATVALLGLLLLQGVNAAPDEPPAGTMCSTANGLRSTCDQLIVDLLVDLTQASAAGGELCVAPGSLASVQVDCQQLIVDQLSELQDAVNAGAGGSGDAHMIRLLQDICRAVDDSISAFSSCQ